jgi:hypothetical protein
VRFSEGKLFYYKQNLEIVRGEIIGGKIYLFFGYGLSNKISVLKNL